MFYTIINYMYKENDDEQRAYHTGVYVEVILSLNVYIYIFVYA